jgi:hypothetical protein
MDTGYALTMWSLVPYRGVRYHLKEWERARRRPLNKEELFNLRHASLRNVIERIFGVVKKRFPLLDSMNLHQYDLQLQITLVRCAVVLHNVIRASNLANDEFDEWNWRVKLFSISETLKIAAYSRNFFH